MFPQITAVKISFPCEFYQTSYWEQESKFFRPIKLIKKF